MADREYAPLSTACVRALMDRVYEKRKAAALEIEKMVSSVSDPYSDFFLEPEDPSPFFSEMLN